MVIEEGAMHFSQKENLFNYNRKHHKKVHHEETEVTRHVSKSHGVHTHRLNYLFYQQERKLTSHLQHLSTTHALLTTRKLTRFHHHEHTETSTPLHAQIERKLNSLVS